LAGHIFFCYNVFFSPLCIAVILLGAFGAVPFRILVTNLINRRPVLLGKTLKMKQVVTIIANDHRIVILTAAAALVIFIVIVTAAAALVFIFTADYAFFGTIFA